MKKQMILGNEKNCLKMQKLKFQKKTRTQRFNITNELTKYDKMK